MEMQSLLLLFQDNLILFSFLAGFITGETVIFSLAFLSANGLFSFWNIIIYCTIGMYFSDFIPLIIGRVGSLRKFFNKKSSAKKSEISEKFIKHIDKHFFLTLLSTKFVYGAAIPTLIYLGYKKTSFKRFALWNIVVEIIFVPTVAIVGWFAGKGYGWVSDIFKDLKIAIMLLVIVIIGIYFVKKWFGEKLTEEQEKLD
jgi:membrane protein DedA with SNARE-associated domain